MQEMHIYGVSFDIVGKQPIVLLKTADGNKFLPIWIGHPEAAAILMKLQGATTPRPMTHDLVTEMLAQLEARVIRITVTELRDSTFYASITIQQDGSEIEIDSRPSDAIALAVRAEAPIFADDRVIEESAIEFEGEEVNEEEIVDEFRKFLDQVTPDEFAVEEGEEEESPRSPTEPEDLVPPPETSRLERSRIIRKSSWRPSAESGPRFAPRQVLEHPLLALRVDEAEPARLLVRLHLCDEPQPLVDRVHDRAVVVRDLLAELADDGIVVSAGVMADPATVRTRASASPGS